MIPYSRSTAYAKFLNAYYNWITSTVGPLKDCVSVSGTIFTRTRKYMLLPLHDELLRMEFAPGEPSSLYLDPTTNRNTGGTKWSESVRSDSTVALYFKTLHHPVIMSEQEWVAGATHSDDNFIVVHKDDCESFKKLLETRDDARWLTHITPNGFVSSKLAGKVDWDALTLSEDVTKNVKNDFEKFLSNREWFIQAKVAWRRGYLLYGPPGNGKTSIIKQLSLHPKIEAFTIDLGNPKICNEDLTRLFNMAGGSTPALVILEDIDRLFSENAAEDNKRLVTLQHFLNCLDGINTPEGIVIVATANDPKYLDPALMQRPGRFDKLVEFKNPGTEERLDYFRGKKNLTLTAEECQSVVVATNNFSFAQLKEVYVSAALSSWNAGEEHIGVNHLTAAAKAVKDSIKDLGSYSYKKGTNKLVDARGSGLGFSAPQPLVNTI